MTPFVALVLYPLWSFALATGLLALRLGRAVRGGLVSLAFALAIWVTGLVLLEMGLPVAERVLPFGMLLAGGFVHAGMDVARRRSKRVLVLAYGWGAAVAALGAVVPRLVYGSSARSMGPAFVPLTVISAIGTVLAIVYLVGLARAAEDARDRRRRSAIAVACAMGGAGGGSVIVLRVIGIDAVALAAPFLFVATLLVGHAVLAGEEGRARQLLQQGAVQAIVTSLLSGVGLTVFFFVLPALAPGGGRSVVWVVVVVFFAALPLEPFRMLVVERVAEVLHRRPTTLPALAREVETSEARADHAERLAELGRVVSAVAHELRNPLGVIAAQTKLLERRGADDETLVAMRAQIERARRFLDDLLRFGKPRPLELRTFEVEPALSLVVSDVRRAFGPSAPQFDVVSAEVRIEADRNAFTDVLTNLVHNACIAAEGSATPVRVAIEDDRHEARISIEDNGPGVPAELEATLFTPFITGRGRDDRHPGTGLGLAIAARWVERHGGTLVHERPAGGGARFIVRWPKQAR